MLYRSIVMRLVGCSAQAIAQRKGQGRMRLKTVKKRAAVIQGITVGPSSSDAYSTNRSTACRPREITGPVRVTHPFHPLFGKEIDCVERRIGWGDDLLFYRDRFGYVTAVPTRWTSVEAEDPFLVVSAGRSYFRVTDLIDLASLITEIQSDIQAKKGHNDV